MTELDRQIVEFEGQWWQARGNKETAIREQFGWSAVRYAQKLNQVLDSHQALAHDPVLVNRLRRIRNRRAVARVEGRGFDGQG